MSSRPLVSVITVFFNAEEFLQESIESVLAQTYGNWELLLVDDGSTDDSTAIALEYADRYPNDVLYLEHIGHQNQGPSASRNLGLSNAQGEYVAFLDSDDVWLPYKLEQQVAILDAQPEAAVLYGNTQRWYGWTGDPRDIERDFVPELVIQSDMLVKPPALLTLSYPMGKGLAPSLSNLIFRRAIVEHIGGFEDAFRGRYHLYDDQAFLVKIYLKESVFVAGQSKYWDRYRHHPDSCCAVTHRAGQYYSARLFFLNWLAEYFSEQGLEDAELWNHLQETRLIAKVVTHWQQRQWGEALRCMLVLLRYYPQRTLIRAYRKLRLRGRSHRYRLLDRDVYKGRPYAS